MKVVRKLGIILLVVFNMIFLLEVDNVKATAGSIKQNSVIKCGSKYYGYHGSPKHWHIVEKEDGKWVSVSSEEVIEPSCYADISNEKIEVTLSKCVDGDTAKFITSDGEIKTTRFLAIDTPESVHPTKEVEEYGKEASNYTCKLLTNAKKITLEFDKNSDKEDKYGRLLAFVYADNKMVQEELLEKGYAKVAYLYDDYTYTSKLQKIEKEAKSKKVGIWGNDVSTSMDDTGEEEIFGDVEVKKTTNKNKDEIWNIISDFIAKLVSKLFEYLESML